MAKPTGFKVAIFTAVAWLFLSAAMATTVIPPTFEEMADRADLVFVGKVVGSRSEWRSVGADRAIFTLVEFETEQVLKGNAGKRVVLQFLGGTVGATTLAVSEVPKFVSGERVFLFVEGNGVQFCPLVGVFHGKFNVRKDDKTGRDIILMHDGNPLRDVHEIGAGRDAQFAPKRVKSSIPLNAEPLSLEDFKDRVRSHFAKQPAK